MIRKTIEQIIHIEKKKNYKTGMKLFTFRVISILGLHIEIEYVQPCLLCKQGQQYKPFNQCSSIPHHSL